MEDAGMGAQKHPNSPKGLQCAASTWMMRWQPYFVPEHPLPVVERVLKKHTQVKVPLHSKKM